MGPTGSVAWERAMKIQEVILRAMAKRITWWQAAEIIGISERQMRRWHRRYEKLGYDGLWARRRGGPSPRPGPTGTGGRSIWGGLGGRSWVSSRTSLRYATLVRGQAGGVVRGVLRAVHGLLLKRPGGRQDRTGASDPGGPSHAGVGHPHDPGVFAAGARTQREEFRHLARTSAAGVAPARDHHGGSGQPLSARRIHRRVQPQVPRCGGAAGQRVSAPAGPGPGTNLFRAAGARGGARQHRADRQPRAANSENPPARHPPWTPRPCLPHPSPPLNPRL